MLNPFTKRLEHGASLTSEDREALDKLIERSSHVSGREVFAIEGEASGAVHVVLSGWACRFKIVAGGSRRIVGFMLPGDHSTVARGTGHASTYGLCALTRCEFAEVDEHALEMLSETRPNLRRALRWSSMMDEAVLQEWLANVGGRPAEKRIAHLLCELLVRLQLAGLATADAYALPLTQSALGDAVGLSPAHVNRTLQALRARGLVFFEDGEIEAPNVARLQKFADFKGQYLTSRHSAAAE